jgi:hypothetical protein
MKKLASCARTAACICEANSLKLSNSELGVPAGPDGEGGWVVVGEVNSDAGAVAIVAGVTCFPSPWQPDITDSTKKAANAMTDRRQPNMVY